MPEHRTLYRIVLTDPPSVDDMRSYQEMGIEPRRVDHETLRLLSGISLYNTEEQARKKAAWYPWLGEAFIAELRIPHDARFEIERTTNSRGHYTLWGEPHAILKCVSRVRHASAEGMQQ